MAQTSFKDWLQFSENCTLIESLIHARLNPRLNPRLNEGRDDGSDWSVWKKQTNQFFSTPEEQGGLGFPEYDWAGVFINAMHRESGSRIRGQDLFDMISTGVNRFIETMKGLQDAGGAEGVGGGASQETVEKVKAFARNGEVERLIKWVSTHAKKWARTLGDYTGSNANGRWRSSRTDNMGQESDDDDYKPVAFASRQSGEDQEMEFRHLAAAIVQELKRAAVGGKPSDQQSYRLAADVAAHWFQNLSVELGAYHGPTPDRNRSPLMTQRELQAAFPQVSLGTMNTQIMPRIKQAVVSVIGNHGSGAAQMLAQKLGGAAAEAV